MQGITNTKIVNCQLSTVNFSKMLQKQRRKVRLCLLENRELEQARDLAGGIHIDALSGRNLG